MDTEQIDMNSSRTQVTVTVAMARNRHPAVSRNRFYEAIEGGGLRAIRVGRRFAIPVQDLDLWVSQACPVSSDE